MFRLGIVPKTVEPLPVVEVPATQDPNEAFFELINSATQPPTPPKPIPTPKPTPKLTPKPTPKPMPKPTPKPASHTPDEYDVLYQEEDVDDNTVKEYQVNGADCGLPSMSVVNSLVVRGEDTRQGDWPWMAAMYQVSDKKFRCAGSLISRRHVVTAAHCVTVPVSRTVLPASTLLIRLGRYDLDKEESTEQIRAIDQILINPKYTKSRKQDFDIALMILKTAAVITDYVRTVCMWNDNMDITLASLTSKIGLAPGWGKDEQGVMAKDLKLARMPVRSQSVCVESDPEFFSAIISDKTFCAGYTNGTTLCNGDSGGGLFFKQEHPKTGKKAWFVRGIVSLSKRSVEFSCGEDNYVVFTDIAMVLKWIKPRLAPPTPSAS